VSEEARAPAASTKLPVWRSAVGAYRDLFGNFRAFLTAAAVPFVLSCAIYLVSSPYAEDLAPQIATTVLETLPVTLFEIAWFRFLLIRGAETRPGLLPRPGRRLPRYLVYSLLLVLLNLPQILLPAAPLPGLGPVAIAALFLLTTVLLGYFSLRFSFVLAWVAIDRPGGFGASWQATGGNGLRLLVAGTLVSLPIFFAIGVLVALMPPTVTESLTPPADPASNLANAPLLLGTAAMTYALAAVVASLIARAFCLLTGWSPNRDELLERFE